MSANNLITIDKMSVVYNKYNESIYEYFTIFHLTAGYNGQR